MILLLIVPSVLFHYWVIGTFSFPTKESLPIFLILVSLGLWGLNNFIWIRELSGFLTQKGCGVIGWLPYWHVHRFLKTPINPNPGDSIETNAVTCRVCLQRRHKWKEVLVWMIDKNPTYQNRRTEQQKKDRALREQNALLLIPSKERVKKWLSGEGHKEA